MVLPEALYDHSIVSMSHGVDELGEATTVAMAGVYRSQGNGENTEIRKQWGLGRIECGESGEYSEGYEDAW